MTARQLWVGCFSLLAALSFGLSYGDAFSNQPTYLPFGLQLADPSFLATDWWLNGSTHYHIAFARLVQMLAVAGTVAWPLALLNTALIAGSLAAAYGLVARLVPGRPALVGWTLFVVIFVLAQQSMSLSGTYLFSTGLQPSTIATFCFLMGMLWFVDDRPVRSGMILAAGAAFHLNFAIIGIAAFGLAQLAGGRERLVTRLAWQVAPMIVVTALNVPLIIAMDVTAASTADKEAAADILFRVAAAVHYDPRSYLVDFVPFLAWQALGWLEWRVMAVGPARARLRALHLAMLGLIAVAALLTTVVFVTPVARAFLFRLNPFAQAIATILVTAALAQRLCAPAGATDPAPRRDIAIRTAAILAIAWSTGRHLSTPASAGWIISVTGAINWCVVMTVVTAAAFLRRGGLPAVATSPVALLLLLAAIAIPHGLSQPNHFNILSKATRKAEAVGLYRWAATTPPGSLFVIPPQLLDFRLLTQRPVVVDRKAVPMNPTAVLEWYRRMEAVSGRPGFRDFADTESGYNAMDAPRIDAIVDAYHPDYMVLRNTEAIRGLARGLAYSDPAYVVLCLKSSCSEK